MTVVADAISDDMAPVNLPDYILRCYDPDTPGFGDQPGWSSSLESTLDAVTLLKEHTDSKDWSNVLFDAIDSIIQRYAGMQSWSHAGFYLESEDAPDFRTSALVLETLKMLDRLDDVDVEEVLRYLWSSYRYSLTFDSRWFTEGDFESKYWALRTAYTIEDYSVEHYERSAIGQMGLSKMDLDLVLAPDVNRADFVETESYLTWGELLFEESEIFGGGFENEPYDRQLQIVETFQMLTQDPVHSPTMVSLLVDTERFADDIVSHYEQDAGMFRDDTGELSYDATSKALSALELIGKSGMMYDSNWAPYRLIESTYRIQGQIDEWYLSDESLTALDEMYEVYDSLDRIDDAAVALEPIFDSSDSDTGVRGWDETEYRPVATTSALWEDLRPDTPETNIELSDSVGFAPYVAIIGLGLACSFLKNRRVISLLAILIICLFLVQTLGASTMLAHFENVSSALFAGVQRAPLDMSRLGTIWSDMTYSDIIEEYDTELSIEETNDTSLFTPSGIGSSIADMVGRITNNIKVYKQALLIPRTPDALFRIKNEVSDVLIKGSWVPLIS